MKAEYRSVLEEGPISKWAHFVFAWNPRLTSHQTVLPTLQNICLKLSCTYVQGTQIMISTISILFQIYLNLIRYYKNKTVGNTVMVKKNQRKLGLFFFLSMLILPKIKFSSNGYFQYFFPNLMVFPILTDWKLSFQLCDNYLGLLSNKNTATIFRIFIWLQKMAYRLQKKKICFLLLSFYQQALFVATMPSALFCPFNVIIWRSQPCEKLEFQQRWLNSLISEYNNRKTQHQQTSNIVENDNRIYLFSSIWYS